jgi:hypothetical protein
VRAITQKPQTSFPSRAWPWGAVGRPEEQGEKGEEGERNLKESPLGLPTQEASGAGASWGRAPSPGSRHSRAMQMGEAVQRGGLHFKPALMAL